MLWKELPWPTKVRLSTNYIDLHGTMEVRGTWRLTGYYGCPERHRRREAWMMLEHLSKYSPLLWCCIGDYNDLLTGRKKGRRNHPHWLIKGFREATEVSDLIDIGMSGYQFTWEKSRGTPDLIEERLDRAMVTQPWLEIFPRTIVYSLEAAESDHLPIYLDTRHPTRRQV